MPIQDKFNHLTAGLESPGSHLALITPNDAVDLTNVTRALVLGSDDPVATPYVTVKITTEGGETLTTIPLMVGVEHSYRVTRVWTGGTATKVMGVW